MPTIIARIDTAEANLSACSKRLTEVSTALRRGVNSEQHRLKLKEESNQLHTLVKTYEEEIASLRKENRKSMLMSVFIFVLLLIGYMLYSTYYKSG